VLFPNNMLLLDFSPFFCCCIYGVCIRGVQILRTRRSSCRMPTRLWRELSSINFTLVMINHVVKYKLWYVTSGLGLTISFYLHIELNLGNFVIIYLWLLEDKYEFINVISEWFSSSTMDSFVPSTLVTTQN